MANNEKLSTKSKEHLANPAELERMRHEAQERMREKLEVAGEKSKENLEGARHEARNQAKSIEREQKKEGRSEKAPSRERRKDGPASKKELDTNFKKIMTPIQRDMPPVSRAFSKFIHNKSVEKISNAVGGTIARPNAILFGSLFAFIFTFALLLIARHYGYPLSGAETIASFTIGWFVGLLVDYIRLEFTGGRIK